MRIKAGLSIWLVAVIVFVMPESPAAIAGETKVSKDTNHDGLIDQVACMDDQGTILRLELYNDGPDRPSAVQYYTNKTLTRVEKDTKPTRTGSLTSILSIMPRIGLSKVWT